jgi:hypothetical protein
LLPHAVVVVVLARACRLRVLWLGRLVGLLARGIVVVVVDARAYRLRRIARLWLGRLVGWLPRAVVVVLLALACG